MNLMMLSIRQLPAASAHASAAEVQSDEWILALHLQMMAYIDKFIVERCAEEAHSG